VLIHDSLDDWHRWQRRRQGIARRARTHSPSRPPERLGYFSQAGEEDGSSVVVALDSLATSQRAALLHPAQRLRDRGHRVLLLAPLALAPDLSHAGFAFRGEATSLGWGALADGRARAVLAAGDYLAAGRLGRAIAAEFQAPYFVVQHGVLTPFAPPLPRGAHLLAWTKEDARFWWSSRGGESSVVGSQLLWEAARKAAPPVPARPLCFLGQLHGAELNRRTTLRTLSSLRRQTEVVYRPHPGERDMTSRMAHLAWRAQGVPMSDTHLPLIDSGFPVAAIFSTGLLEAMAAGIPAFGVCANAPPWVLDLWDRYGIPRYGTSTPPAPPVPRDEPVSTIVDLVESRS